MRTNGRITLTSNLDKPKYNPETSEYEEIFVISDLIACLVTNLNPQKQFEYFGTLEKQIVNVNLLKHLDLTNVEHATVECPDLHLIATNCKILKVNNARNNKQSLYMEVIE